ncbi:uncharacterized protein N7459_005451 [Penicillium hispanicum]|uniref:uncharacterized protein n=1 Tax=Penicillium hispanicum TaxID=1080232 RepID=UPI00253FECC0|nr:uncharacterized protein N7459_005451 [Penicillium hispanicum]KAJ5579466.1 hypothetical protein N7459_005451 [Penicillium hispanicum]
MATTQFGICQRSSSTVSISTVPSGAIITATSLSSVTVQLDTWSPVSDYLTGSLLTHTPTGTLTSYLTSLLTSIPAVTSTGTGGGRLTGSVTGIATPFVSQLDPCEVSADDELDDG